MTATAPVRYVSANIACMRYFAVLPISLIPLLAQTPPEEFFEKKIRPVLVKNCQGCHNAKVKTAGLDMSSADGFAKGGASGLALTSKDSPDSSLLLKVVSYEGQLKMPPAGKLSDEVRADIAAWVKMGAPWPGATSAATPTAAKTGRVIGAEDRKFWAFQPVRKPAVPDVKNKVWVKSPIDAFVLAKLEEKGLRPAPPAGKVALLRRVTFDVTGLPPTEKEISGFVADTAPNAFEKVVDRLLASPRYGEKWGRHWLDVARYADSTGNDEDHRYPYAWRYRDYVIESFNNDLPYNQFMREQIAGDLLPGNFPNGINRRGIVATGLLALGAKAVAQQDKTKMLYDVYDEQVDVVSKAFLGVTLACARCHDHKFDPLLTRDYYSLVSIFASTKNFKDPSTHVSKLLFVPLAPKEEYERYTAHQRQVTLKGMEIEDVAEEELERYTATIAPRLADYMLAAREVYENKAVESAVARDRNLKPEVLAEWVKYLKPQGDSRVHLTAWDKAPKDQWAAVAQTYQADFDKELGEWNERIRKWREKFRRMSLDMDMPPPERPKFEAAKNQFFFEVLFTGPFSVAKDKRDAIFSGAAKTKIAALKKDHEALKASSPPEPDMACAVEESTPVDQKVFVRGDYNSPGELAPKAVPTVLTNEDPKLLTKGSGRLEFANWLADSSNPLPARVMVNRIWNGHFGEGIVRTPDNFGKMGERPTHPELLDYLAARFVESGWSMKSMHRLMLLSSAYQMSSNISPEANQKDPENRLFSRFPQRRLTVEEIRDGLLAIDGTLDLTMGGTLQTGFGTDGENSNNRLSVRPESNKRRMVYLPLRRANLPTMLNLFDFGDATTMTGKRPLTTVAPQALFMMNSGFVAERSRNLADSVAKQTSDPAARLRSLYVRVLNREPDPSEMDAGLTYIKGFQQKFAGKRTESDAWFSLSRILIGSNEFIYLD